LVAVLVVAMALGLGLAGSPVGAQSQEAGPQPVVPSPPTPAAGGNGDVGGDVIGGGEIPLSDAPWQVSVWVDTDPASNQFVYFNCGGTLISTTVVLTAAHCLYDEDFDLVGPGDVGVGIGEHDLEQIELQNTPLRGVSRLSRHPRYETTITNDIAYLRLSSPVTEVAGQIEVIDTAEPTDVASYPGGTDAEVSGWGSTVGDTTSPSFPDYPDELHGTTVPVVDDAECIDDFAEYAETHPEFAGEVIDEPTMVCAGSATDDSCYGDSGGPLWTEDGGPLQIGITSFGPFDCADPIAPGVYTEVAAYADMTEAHLGADPFPDVRFGHPFFTEIWFLERDGIVGGYQDGTYKPSNAVSRQAMSAFMYRLAGEPPFEPSSQTFSDVSPSHPFYDEIEWMAEEGISTGYQDGRFRPSEPVTRQAMSAFMYRLAGEPPFVPSGHTFWDVGPSHPFYDEVEWMAEEGITTGYADGGFYPSAPVTRQSMAAFMYRLQPLLT
jgi:hypothetical protein